MKKLSKYLVIAGLGLSLASCNLLDPDAVTDPNSPSENAVLENATKSDIQNLVTGLESENRNYNGVWTLFGAFGRDLYFFGTSDPNFFTQWLQLPTNSAPDAEDNTTFFGDGSAYESPYGAVRQSAFLNEAVNNTSELTDAEKNGVLGFSNTIKAYQLIWPWLHQGTNGIRVDFDYSDPLNPGPFLSQTEALARIRTILDEANTTLGSAGSSFVFELSSGFDGFDTPSTMQQVNRAIAARFALYAEDWDGALTALNGSFLNLNAATVEDLKAGPQHVYAGGDDRSNPFYYVPNGSADRIIVGSPLWVSQAEAGDGRVDDKLDLRDAPAEVSDLPLVSADWQEGRYEQDGPVPFIRNEELILIYAEAKIQRNTGTDLVDAVAALNTIRTIWGLPVYSGAVTQAALIDEMLNQRRYSLWGEGHRWVDMRRYGRLDQIDTSLDGGRVPTQVARPQGETDWEEYANGN